MKSLERKEKWRKILESRSVLQFNKIRAEIHLLLNRSKTSYSPTVSLRDMSFEIILAFASWFLTSLKFSIPYSVYRATLKVQTKLQVCCLWGKILNLLFYMIQRKPIVYTATAFKSKKKRISNELSNRWSSASKSWWDTWRMARGPARRDAGTRKTDR